MRIKGSVAIFLFIFLVGCATTRKDQDIQFKQLQSRISYLETELQQKNQQIGELEDELERAQNNLAKQKVEKSTTLQLSVKQIQTALKNAGFYKGPIDGKSGLQTKESITEFQKANGLKPDGIVGKCTAEKLRNYLP